MSGGQSENAELVLELLDAWNDGDVDGFLGLLHPEVEVVFPADVPEPGPFHGRDEVRGWIERFRDAWDEHRVGSERLEEAEERVVTILRLAGRGRASGAEIETRQAHVFTIEDGLISGWRGYGDAQDAFREAGLDAEAPKGATAGGP